jgi:Zn-dependent protease
MGRSIRIGSARGIAIQVHPSFALVLLWVIYQWGFSAHAGVQGVLFGALVLLAVFACVLVHELAHAFVAIHYGIRVRDITLLPVGGVARVEYVPLSPKVETLIALAGPAINVAIAAFLTPVVIFIAMFRNVSSPVDVLLYADEISIVGFILYLWVANVLLTVFNLIPAFPMDGGRVLRAAISLFCSRLTATRVAVGIGYVLAALLTLFGLWVGDYLMPLVSLFVLVAAQMEYRNVAVEASLRALPVGQFALWESGGIRPDEPLAHAIQGGPRDLAVTQDGEVVGMLWRHEILHHLNGSHHDLLVRDIMDRRFNAVESTDSVYDVHLWLTAANRPAVPVVENGRYRGIFTFERLAHVYQHIGQRSMRRYRSRLQTAWNRLRLASR